MYFVGVVGVKVSPKWREGYFLGGWSGDVSLCCGAGTSIVSLVFRFFVTDMPLFKVRTWGFSFLYSGQNFASFIRNYLRAKSITGVSKNSRNFLGKVIFLPITLKSCPCWFEKCQIWIPGKNLKKEIYNTCILK